jgi:hypothetical protein
MMIYFNVFYFFDFQPVVKVDKKGCARFAIPMLLGDKLNDFEDQTQ